METQTEQEKKFGCYCNKCNKGIELKNMTEWEFQEVLLENSFICSNCINKEMEQEQKQKGFKLNWTNKENAVKNLQTEQYFKSLGIEVYN